MEQIESRGPEDTARTPETTATESTEEINSRICNTCGELGQFEYNPNGSIGIAAYRDKRICCLTSASTTKDEAIVKWQNLTAHGDEHA